MNADSCRKPGYTRRSAPRKRSGTQPIRLASNQSIECAVASSFTRVGLMRQSIGPAISVRLRGVQRLWFSAMIDAAASAATHGWHTARTCAPGPIASRKAIRCVMYSSSPNLPCSSDTSRALRQSVMNTSWSPSIVRTVSFNSVAKCPDIGATISTRGCATSTSLRKCSSSPKGRLSATSSLTATSRSPTSTVSMPKDGRAWVSLSWDATA